MKIEYINSNPIAILMASYNSQKYIAEQIESIINQSYKFWTLYIRDDGSTDDTKKIIGDYSRKYDNIILINDSNGNLGCRDNFFRLLEIVQSKYYMFSDSDDVWLPNKVKVSLDEIIKAEKENPPHTPILIHSDMMIVDQNLNILQQSMWESARFNPDKIKTINYLGIHGFIGGATAIFNKEAKRVSIPFSKKVYLHDLWIGLKVLESGKIISLHKQLMLYRQHGNNTAGAGEKSKLSLIYKLRNFKKVLKVNLMTARMLKSIGWGGYTKYLYNKLKLIYLLRSGKAL